MEIAGAGLCSLTNAFWLPLITSEPNNSRQSILGFIVKTMIKLQLPSKFRFLMLGIKCGYENNIGKKELHRWKRKKARHDTGRILGKQNSIDSWKMSGKWKPTCHFYQIRIGHQSRMQQIVTMRRCVLQPWTANLFPAFHLVQSWCPMLALGAQVALLQQVSLLPNAHWETHKGTNFLFLQTRTLSYVWMDSEESQKALTAFRLRCN